MEENLPSSSVPQQAEENMEFSETVENEPLNDDKKSTEKSLNLNQPESVIETKKDSENLSKADALDNFLEMEEGSQPDFPTLSDDASHSCDTSGTPIEDPVVKEVLDPENDNLSKLDDNLAKLDEIESDKTLEKEPEKEETDNFPNLPETSRSLEESLEPKPTNSPPLLLLDSESTTVEEDTVFGGDLSRIPEQILAEPDVSDKEEELDERTENEIASNIEDQLREFEGSDDEAILNKDDDVLDNLEATLGDTPTSEIETRKTLEDLTEKEDDNIEHTYESDPVDETNPDKNSKSEEIIEKDDTNIEHDNEEEFQNKDPFKEQDTEKENENLQPSTKEYTTTGRENDSLVSLLQDESIESKEVSETSDLAQEKEIQDLDSMKSLLEEPLEKVSEDEYESTYDDPNQNEDDNLNPSTSTNIDSNKDKKTIETEGNEELSEIDSCAPVDDDHNFEAVDVDMTDKEKSINLDEKDALSDDRTQLDLENLKDTENISKLDSAEDDVCLTKSSEESQPQMEVDEYDDDGDQDLAGDKTKKTATTTSNNSPLAESLEKDPIEDIEMTAIEEEEPKDQSGTIDPLLKEMPPSGEEIDLLQEESPTSKDQKESEVKDISEPMEDDSENTEPVTEPTKLTETENDKETEISHDVVDEKAVDAEKESDIISTTEKEKSKDKEKEHAIEEKEHASEEKEHASEEKEHASEEKEHASEEKDDDSDSVEIIEPSEKEQASTPEEQRSEGGVDDLNEGQGVDEEVCLLPDSERDISDADKKRAILAKEAAEKVDKEKNEAESNEKEKEPKDNAISKKNEKSSRKEAISNVLKEVKESPNTSCEIVPAETDEVTIIEDDQPEKRLDAGDNQLLEPPDPEKAELNEFDIKEITTDVKHERCAKCRRSKMCKYKFLKDTELKYLCDLRCVHNMRSQSKAPWTLSARKVVISLVIETKQSCLRCKAMKNCRYRFTNQDNGKYNFLCESRCLNLFIGKNIEKFLVRRRKYLVEENSSNDPQKCIHCGESKTCKYYFQQDAEKLYICHDDCFNLLAKEEPERFRLKRRSVRVRDLRAPTSTPHPEPENKILARSESEAEAARIDRESSFLRRCAQCFLGIEVSERTLQWETIDFCNGLCLSKYQNVIGASCTTCANEVPHQSLGKYCVRFGFEIRQFCCSKCLDSFKKGLKVCSYCQKDISKDKEGFLAPVGDKTQFKDFCTQACMKKYEDICNPRKKLQTSMCAVCNNEKPVRVEIMLDNREHLFCSNPCFSAFKFVNNIFPDQCTMCLKFFERKSTESYTIYQDKTARVFCCKICMNIYIILNRKIVPCQWCKVKKYNFDMIQKQCGMVTLLLCSLNCLTLYGVSLNAISMLQQKCDQCDRQSTPQYHLTMSDASIRNFCTYQCVMSFQSQFGRTPLTLEDPNPSKDGANKTKAPFPTGLPKRVKAKSNMEAPGTVTPKLPTKGIKATTPIISNVTSLANQPPASKSNNATPVRNLRGGRLRGKPALTQTPKPVDDEDERPLVLLAAANKKSGQTSSISTRRTIAAEPPVPTIDIEEPLPEPMRPSEPTKRIESRNTHTQTLRVAKRSIGVGNTFPQTKSTTSSSPTAQAALPEKPDKVEYKTQVITVPPPPVMVANKQTMCKPLTSSKGITCRPHPCSISTQTDGSMEKKIFIPIPVPIYIPQPMYMYSAPFPVPVPIPLPIPVPIFIPTTRNSADGILKEIKKIQDKMPTDPFEAELLMMAEMVAGDKKKNDSDSESEGDHIAPIPHHADEDDEEDEEVGYTTEVIEPSNSFGEDVLQMALKMATEYDEPAVDLESAMTANTITHVPSEDIVEEQELQHHHMIMIDPQSQRPVAPSMRGRKRTISPIVPTGIARNNRLSTTPPNKKQRRSNESQNITHEESVQEPVEKPDVNMCLKYTFGVNAWKQWVMTKNADLEKSSLRRKPFKSELLQLTADELNYSLCLFVKEVRKPNGSEYAPDTIYYLVLGIQQYLYENGRIDNIFTDPYYERFTDCLDEVAKKFSVLYNDSQYIVTRVEEEHLWECKQLGAHSPHVLLSTLMFFNTKHFNLTTVEEHMQLSFSHIMKHWKRNPSGGGTKAAGSRNVLLRFYPPQVGPEANPRKKKVYEQQENEENPLRCPVKLYEFYLSKCPESVKTRNDVFYLQPERSCVPDSPVWYSTQPLSRDALNKMLHRVKMVKEINIALLTS